MLFMLPPAEVVSYVLDTLSFSGLHGLPLSELWSIVARKLDAQQLDEFQLQNLWHWLFVGFKAGVALPVFIAKNLLVLPIIPDYNEFIAANGPALDLVVKPTPETQWEYLTGTKPSRQIRLTADKPFNLLCEIAKHGPQGIVSPALCRLTGQDPRSLPSRYKKLEESGFIVKRNVYEELIALHTHLFIHVRFAPREITGGAPAGLPVSRSAAKVRRQVVDAVKCAPNQLRGFVDLKRELHLESSLLASRFFRAIVLELHRNKYVEKLLLNNASTGRSIFSIKFLKDLPGTDEDMSAIDLFSPLPTEKDDIDSTETNETLENDADDADIAKTQNSSAGNADAVDIGVNDRFDRATIDERSAAESLSVPLINGLFPISTQAFQCISSSGANGTTVKQLLKALLGWTDNRPLNRFLDNSTSYDLVNTTLVPRWPIPDKYPHHTIVKTFDSVGKLEFYRYSVREKCAHESVKPHTKALPVPAKTIAKSLKQINKDLYVPLTKVLGQLFGNSSKPVKTTAKKYKKRLLSQSDLEVEKPRKLRLSHATRARIKDLVVNSGNEDIDSFILLLQDTIDVGHATAQAAAALALDAGPAPDPTNESFEPENIDESIMRDADYEDANPTYEKAPVQHKVEEQSGPISTLVDMPSINAAPPGPTPSLAPSMRARQLQLVKMIARRNLLLEKIREFGGVTYTSAALIQSMDRRLGVTTRTDHKTLARDIALLVQSGQLDVEDVRIDVAGRSYGKKLLILRDEAYRPTQEQIDRVREQCVTDSGPRSRKIERRTIFDEVTLFNSKAATKRDQGARLSSLGGNSRLTKANTGGPARARATRRAKKPSAPTPEAEALAIAASTAQEPLTTASALALLLKRHIRPTKLRKPHSKRKAPVSRKYRAQYKFDQSDATTLYRAIVICKTFLFKIDFARITAIFPGLEESEIRQRWTHLRAQLGGLPVVNRGVEAFEQIVMKAIEDDLVTTQDLEDVKLQFFLDLWRDTDGSVLHVPDKMPLFNSSFENSQAYTITDTGEDLGPAQAIEAEMNSMKIKESIFSRTTFYAAAPEYINRSNESVRTLLKAIFNTSEELFDGKRVQQILSEYPEQIIQETTAELIKDREMVYSSEEGRKNRFVLTDKVFGGLLTKLGPRFFKSAAEFTRSMDDWVQANRGLILSHNIQSGPMAAILQLVLSKAMNLFHIDKDFEMRGYESRLVSSEELACEIVAVGEQEGEKHASQIASIPVPDGKPCSRAWLDMSGQINHVLWSRILVTFMYHVHMRPGVPGAILYNRMSALISREDFAAVIDWLVASGFITHGEHDGFWTTDRWFTALGYE